MRHKNRFLMQINRPRRQIQICIAASAIVWATPVLAFAQSDQDVTRAIARAAATVELLQGAEGAADASASIQMATARLDEARAARDQSHELEAVRRAQEAELNAKVALAEVVQMRGQRRAKQLSDAVAISERELNN